MEGDRKPKGTLVAVGGNEDKKYALKVLRSITELPEGGTKTVEVLPIASSIPKEVAEDYLHAFGKLDIPNVHIMDIDSREDARDPDLVKRIREADVVYFTGGDQLRITSLIGGTPLHDAIHGHYMRGGVVAGTSAGAAAMSATMIFEGDPAGSMRKGNTQMTPGLGLLRSAVVDTHFIQRGRVGRLLEVIASNPGHVGIGVGEDTGIIVREGHRIEVIGEGVVVVVEGHRMGYTNIHDVSLGKPIAVEGLVLHTLTADHGYDLDDQRYLHPQGRNRDA